tara:strand:- start:70272 stop:70526 length:255 start_codon:yes stop_codon:yes gene_type:complete
MIGISYFHLEIKLMKRPILMYLIIKFIEANVKLCKACAKKAYLKLHRLQIVPDFGEAVHFSIHFRGQFYLKRGLRFLWKQMYVD